MKKTLFVAGLATILLSVAAGLCLIIDMTGKEEYKVSDMADEQICTEKESTEYLIPALYAADRNPQRFEN